MGDCHRVTRSLISDRKVWSRGYTVLKRNPSFASPDDGRRTTRERQHANRSLPLPPLMDPLVTAALEKFTKRKPEPDPEQQTEFQRQLAANPYARALTSPVRLCCLTNVRLPAHFLQPFSLRLERAGKEDQGRRRRGSAKFVPSHPKELPQNSVLPNTSYAINRKTALDAAFKKKFPRLLSQLMLKQLEEKKAEFGRPTFDASTPTSIHEKQVQEAAAALDELSLIEEFHQLVTGVDDIEQGRDGMAGAVLQFDDQPSQVQQDRQHSAVPRYRVLELLGAENHQKSARLAMYLETGDETPKHGGKDDADTPDSVRHRVAHNVM